MVDKTQNSVLGIPAVPKDASPSVQSYLRALAEAVEKSIGIRGDPENRNPTVKELADAGILERTDFSAKFNPNDVNEQNRGYKSAKAGTGGGRVKMFTSERQSSGANKEHIFKHGLGKIPDIVQIDIHFINTFTNIESNLKPGDVLTVAPSIHIDSSGVIGASIIKNNKEVRIYTGALAISLFNNDLSGTVASVGLNIGGNQMDEIEMQIRALIF